MYVSKHIIYILQRFNCICLYVCSCTCTCTCTYTLHRQLFVSALMCELERENIRFPDMTNDEFGVHGSNYYRIRGVGREVKLVFKQHNELRAHHLENMRTFTKFFLESPALSTMSEGGGGGGHDGVMIVLQAGTWYFSATLYRQHVERVFAEAFDLAEKYAQQRKHITFVWAEQVTQHWPTDNGYFLTGKGVSRASLCTPLINMTESADWRNDIVWQSFLRDGSGWRRRLDSLAPYARVRVLNFRALTSDMSDFHMRQQKKDCTHYCYTPMMYQSIYHQLAQISADLAAEVASSRKEK